MAIIKCKMCGGTLEIINNESIATCEYCGTQQTLPRLNDERKANLYDRANHFRRNNEFDKAMGIYEQILNDDRTDAEAYWSLVLCRYGIEYVEDPATHKRVPTVNRAQFTSIFDDDNYKSALQYADGYQCSLYEEEAKAINEIQKGILAISQKEEPFDVFICYKETDQHGRRTHDSVLANDLYHQLTQEGFKVFFARITLEDKLGSAYEPYIFAALNSAKVMVVLGTRPEFFNAVWVKNEWSRYLSLIKGGAKKVLIPAYKDMDPYDLPEEFSHLQAQDMNKLGFMQDLIRGIKKLAGANEQPQTVVHETVVANTNTAPLLRRAFMFLEDGDWEKADEFCEQVLNLEPENAQAYVGKLMAELHVKTQLALADCKEPFDNNGHYQKVMRFANAQMKAEIQGYIEHINTRNENELLEGIYSKAAQFMKTAKTERTYKEAASLFAQIPEYKDSETQRINCIEKAVECRKKEEQHKEEQRKQETENRKQKRVRVMALLAVCFVGILMAIGYRSILQNQYNNAVKMLKNEQYEDAQRAFGKLGNFKDSPIKVHLIKYRHLQNKVAANFNDIAGVKADGLVVITGHAQKHDIANELQDIEAVFRGGYALKADGQVIAFEEEDHLNVANWSGIIAVDSSGGHVVGLKSNGTVVAVGSNDSGQCNVDKWTNVVAIATESWYTIGLKADGTVISVGRNIDGRCNVGTWKNIVAIDAGFSYSVALKENGTVVVAGDAPFGTEDDIKKWKNIVDIAAGNEFIVGLTADGKVLVAESPVLDMGRKTATWKNVVAISANGGTLVGLRADGTVVAVGGSASNEVASWNLLQ